MVAITLKAARVNVGLTQGEAAEKLGISEETLRAYENYKRFPNVPIIKKIETLYNLSYNDILFLPRDHG